MKLRPTMIRSILVALAAAALFICSTSYAAQVSQIDIVGLKTISEDVVRDVIAIKPGDAFTLEAIDRSIGYLRKWGVFDSIEVTPQVSPEGVLVTIRLEEAVVVDTIDLAGNYPYIENKIRKYLTLNTGDVYTAEHLEEQVERIDSLYKKMGYVNTRAYSEVKSVPEVNGVEITIHIKRGSMLRYRNIEVAGNHAFPKGRFVSKINPLKPYSERRLSDAIRGMREFYHKNGYPKARVKLSNKTIDFKSGDVDVEIEVNEGPKVDIEFKGFPHISRKLLRNTITILKEGSIDDFEIEMSSEEIAKLLRARGFPDVKVEGEKKTLPDGTILITFVIDEGNPQKIKFLNFSGSKDANTSKITEWMKNRPKRQRQSGAYLSDQVEADNESIENSMKGQGYLDAKAGRWIIKPTREGHTLDITVPIDAGERTMVGRIEFRGSNAFDDAKLLKAINAKVGLPFNFTGLVEDRDRLLAFFADNGFPYAEVKEFWEIDGQTGEAVISFDVIEGDLVRIGRILVVGDVLTSQKAIKKAMAIREGDPFSYRKIMDSQLNVRRLGPFSYVNISAIGLEDKNKLVNLKVKIEEQRPFHIDLGVNYATDEYFTGSLTFTNMNAFGWAKTNTLKLTGGQYLDRAEIVWLDPRFLGSSFEMTTNAWLQYRQRPSYTFVQGAGGLGWFRRFRKLGFLFRWEMDKNYFVKGDSVAADADSLRNNLLSKISLSSSFDSRDSFSDPRRGFYTMGGVDIFNEIMGNNVDFFTFSWAGEGDYSPFNRFTFSTELRFGRIQTIAKNMSVPTNELLFLGGNDTVRGYSEDSLGPTNAAGKATGARTRWIGNEELRIRLFSHFQLAGFFDIGCLTDTFSAIDWNAIRYSTGIGLRYVTPVGPIRLDYGFKLDRRAGESIGRLHFTFGYVF